MDFLDQTTKRYSELPNVKVSHHSDMYLVININDDPMKSIHITLFTDIDHRTLYQITPQGDLGYATLSTSDARDYVWVCYLDMIGDLV